MVKVAGIVMECALTSPKSVTKMVVKSVGNTLIRVLILIRINAVLILIISRIAIIKVSVFFDEVLIRLSTKEYQSLPVNYLQSRNVEY